MPETLSQDEYVAILKLDFLSFVERCFYELAPDAELSSSPHLAVMASRIEACLAGGCRRLIINLPPRSLKSIMVSVALPAWMLGRNPSAQIICASYVQDLADKHARDTRTIMESEFYKNLYPATRLSSEKRSVGEFLTTMQGFRLATSVGGAVTGRGGDIIIIDDPLKPTDALSDIRRKIVNDWMDNTVLSRLNDKENGIIIILMQRLHQDDLVGHVLGQGDWEVLSFPAIAEEDEDFFFDTVLGRSRYQRQIGDVLDPRRESLTTLLEMKARMGTYEFESQYHRIHSRVGAQWS